MKYQILKDYIVCLNKYHLLNALIALINNNIEFQKIIKIVLKVDLYKHAMYVIYLFLRLENI